MEQSFQQREQGLRRIERQESDQAADEYADDSSYRMQWVQDSPACARERSRGRGRTLAERQARRC